MTDVITATQNVSFYDETGNEIGTDIKRAITDYRMALDYYDPGDGALKVRYLGKAPQTAAATDPTWVVQRLTWVVLGNESKVTNIQVLENIAWADRATAGWADDV